MEKADETKHSVTRLPYPEGTDSSRGHYVRTDCATPPPQALWGYPTCSKEESEENNTQTFHDLRALHASRCSDVKDTKKCSEVLASSISSGLLSPEQMCMDRDFIDCYDRDQGYLSKIGTRRIHEDIARPGDGATGTYLESSWSKTVHECMSAQRFQSARTNRGISINGVLSETHQSNYPLVGKEDIHLGLCGERPQHTIFSGCLQTVGQPLSALDEGARDIRVAQLKLYPHGKWCSARSTCGNTTKQDQIQNKSQLQLPTTVQCQDYARNQGQLMSVTPNAPRGCLFQAAENTSKQICQPEPGLRTTGELGHDIQDTASRKCLSACPVSFSPTGELLQPYQDHLSDAHNQASELMLQASQSNSWIGSAVQKRRHKDIRQAHSLKSESDQKEHSPVKASRNLSKARRKARAPSRLCPADDTIVSETKLQCNLHSLPIPQTEPTYSLRHSPPTTVESGAGHNAARESIDAVSYEKFTSANDHKTGKAHSTSPDLSQILCGDQPTGGFLDLHNPYIAQVQADRCMHRSNTATGCSVATKADTSTGTAVLKGIPFQSEVCISGESPKDTPMNKLPRPNRNPRRIPGHKENTEPIFMVHTNKQASRFAPKHSGRDCKQQIETGFVSVAGVLGYELNQDGSVSGPPPMGVGAKYHRMILPAFFVSQNNQQSLPVGAKVVIETANGKVLRSATIGEPHVTSTNAHHPTSVETSVNARMFQNVKDCSQVRVCHKLRLMMGFCDESSFCCHMVRSRDLVVHLKLLFRGFSVVKVPEKDCVHKWKSLTTHQSTCDVPKYKRRTSLNSTDNLRMTYESVNLSDHYLTACSKQPSDAWVLSPSAFYQHREKAHEDLKR